MLTERDRMIAERFAFLDRVERFQAELLTIDGVDDVEFDLTPPLSNIPYVIFLPKYNVPYDLELEEYFKRRRELLDRILEVAKAHGLTRTEDRIEDYGQHWYIVTRSNWTKQ